jgi:hypothetical protein
MEEAYHTQQYGPVNPTAKHHWVECNICGMSLVAGSLRSHLETKPDMWECLTAVCKALSLANAKGKGTDGLVIRS